MLDKRLTYVYYRPNMKINTKQLEGKMTKGIENQKMTMAGKADLYTMLDENAMYKATAFKMKPTPPDAHFNEIPVMDILDYLREQADLRADWQDIGHTALSQSLEAEGFTLGMRSRMTMDGERVSVPVLTLIIGS